MFSTWIQLGALLGSERKFGCHLLYSDFCLHLQYTLLSF